VAPGRRPPGGVRRDGGQAAGGRHALRTWRPVSGPCGVALAALRLGPASPRGRRQAPRVGGSTIIARACEKNVRKSKPFEKRTNSPTTAPGSGHTGRRWVPARACEATPEARRQVSHLLHLRGGSPRARGREDSALYDFAKPANLQNRIMPKPTTRTGSPRARGRERESISKLFRDSWVPARAWEGDPTRRVRSQRGRGQRCLRGPSRRCAPVG